MLPGAFSYKQNQQPTGRNAYTASQPEPYAPLRQQTAQTGGQQYQPQQQSQQPQGSYGAQQSVQPPMPMTGIGGVLGNANPAPTPAASTGAATSAGTPNYGNPNWAANSGNNLNNASGWNFYGEGSNTNPLVHLLNSLGVYSFPAAGQAQQFAGNLEGQREGDIQNYLNWASPASQQGMVNSYGNEAAQNANVGAEQSGALQRAAGLGTGYQAGNAQEAGQSAANAKNVYQQEVNSPQYQQQLLSGGLSAIGSGQQNPFLSELMGLSSSANQNREINAQNQTSSGLWSGLSSLGGALFGSGALNGLFGGGGGGAGGSTGGIDYSDPYSYGGAL
jgi:hypothetical protein